MSTLSAPVFKIGKFGKNPNSDNLCILNGPQGPVQFREGEFREGDLCVFVPANTMVSTARPEFSWLEPGADGRARVRAVKLRGIPSVGLLVHAPPGLAVGDDAVATLGLEKYVEPQTHSFRTNSEQADPPANNNVIPVYDVENPWVMVDGIVGGTSERAGDFLACWSFTEKIHGCNWRATYLDGQVHVGSRGRWVKDGKNPWWEGYRAGGDILERLMKANPGIVFFGEAYGYVQDLHYGKPDSIGLKLFDAFDPNTASFWPISRLGTVLVQYDDGLGLMVPFVSQHVGTLDSALERAASLAVGNSFLDATTIREGVVVRPVGEEFMVFGRTVTRLMTKVINPAYHARHGGTEHQ